MLISQICKEKDFETEWFISACDKLKEKLRYHRKLWEWCYIYQVLLERNMLDSGKRGLGFGVGQEPLTDAFASHGCSITATDVDYRIARSKGWVSTNQHARSLVDLNERKICPFEQFVELVAYEDMDMNNIGDQYMNQYDFTWSACTFEHAGSMELAEQFLYNQMNCLRPGGIAVHTTEFNLSSNEDTLNEDWCVIFRLQDIERMIQALRSRGHSISIDYSVGNGLIESFVDAPPFAFEPHLRLNLKGYISTSIGLIIQKGQSAC